MTRHDWLSVGMKLIGIYLSALATCSIIQLSIAWFTLPDFSETFVANLLTPLVQYWLAFFLMRRTSRIVQWIDAETSPSKDAY